MPDPWSIEPGGAFARCAALRIEGLVHAFGLRNRAAEDPTWSEYGREVRVHQVHGARIVRGDEVGETAVEADGTWERAVDLRGAYLAIRTADCVPILLASRDAEFVAAVHAGWRGTAQSIAVRAVETLGGQGCSPEQLIAAIGPSIGACCYPVSPAVAAEVAQASGVAVEAITRSVEGRVRLDLRAANRVQLQAAGIPEESIHPAPWCTACETELFFSYRRDGATAGRQISLIGPRRGCP